MQVGLGVPGIARRASFDVAYDPAALQALIDPKSPGAPPAGGRIPIVIEAVGPAALTRELRFRVIGQPGSTQLAVEGANAVGNDEQPLPTIAPPPQAIKIVPK
jgi:hypothetical protein